MVIKRNDDSNTESKGNEPRIRFLALLGAWFGFHWEKYSTVDMMGFPSGHKKGTDPLRS